MNGYSNNVIFGVVTCIKYRKASSDFTILLSRKYTILTEHIIHIEMFLDQYTRVIYSGIIKLSVVMVSDITVCCVHDNAFVVKL